MLFPISDDDRALSGPSIVTWSLLALNIALFAYQEFEPTFTYGWSVIPYEITTGEDLTGTIPYDMGDGTSMPLDHQPGPSPLWLTIISAMFMHGGLGHIGGNMLYLWIFGDNIEHRFGPLKFLSFYLVSGIAATFAQIFMDPTSIIANLGASGAIAGVLGAYLVLFPRNMVHAIFLIRSVSLPAFIVIGAWVIMQFVGGFGSLGVKGGGVAYAAHIGGFIAGAGLALLLRGRTEERDSIITRSQERDSRTNRIW